MTGELVAQFAAVQRAAGYRSYVSRLSTRVPLAYLRQVGAIPVPQVTKPGPAEQLLAEFSAYLARERGLVVGTIRNYERAARTFLEDRAELVGGLSSSG